MFDIEKHAPNDFPMRIAWVSCLRWAIGEPEILDAFTADTGITYSAPKNAIEKMIDEASGHGEKVIESFIEWFNVNVWGVNASGSGVGLDDFKRKVGE